MSEEVEILPCPFCGHEKIRVMADKLKKGVFKGDQYTYGYCKVCGCHGPSAYSVGKDDEENYTRCIERWNERCAE